MEMKTLFINMTLADGTVVPFTKKYGASYVSATQLDESVFTDENLTEVHFLERQMPTEDSDEWDTPPITDIETDDYNLTWNEQQEQEDGTWHCSFFHKSEEQLAQEAKEAKFAQMQNDILELKELVAELKEKLGE